MRRVLTLATTFLVGSAAFAQVEPRMAGDWRSGAEFLHISADGRYQKSLNGQVTESGRITSNNGNWTLKSDNGRSDSGSFSFISGNLTLHGGMSGSWTPSSSAIHTLEQRANAPSSQGYNPPPPPPNPNSQNPALLPSSQSYSSMYGHSNPLPGYTNAIKPPGIPDPPAGGYQIKPQAYVPGPPIQTAPYAPPENHAYLPDSQLNGYSANVPYEKRPGYYKDEHGHWIHPATEHGGSVHYINAADIKPNMRPNNTNTFEQNATTQWGQRGQAPGWQSVPKGGYIPVMKDNKARSYWRGF